MQLSIVNENVQITWEWYEQLLTFNFNETFVIPINHIAAVTITNPASSWAEIRCPGTGIPGIIKAGTYYSNRGKEFWYVTQDKNYLTLELQDEPFQRIILTVDDHHTWADRINQSMTVSG